MTEAARRVAASFGSRFLRSYVRGKLRSDPVYDAVLARVRDTTGVLVDVGCGVGLLELYLRENGVGNEITGIDHDERKVATAQAVAARYRDLHFRRGDAREAIPAGSNVLLVDVLHYFSHDDQRRILDNAAAAVPAGGFVIVRDAIRDGSLRYRLTAAQEMFSRAIRWLRAERLNCPSRDDIVAPFAGFDQEIVPMFGRTPFNNYLFVFRRPASGITNR